MKPKKRGKRKKAKAMEERNPKRMKSTILLPDDIFFSILSKLSVKSLLRFTSVSKSMSALIKSSTFVVAYHRNQIYNKNNNIIDSYILYMPDDDHMAWQVCSLLRTIDTPLPNYVDQCNLLLPLTEYDLVGGCEGLICLRKDPNIYIWNPCVGTMKIVPPAPPPPEKAEFIYQRTQRPPEEAKFIYQFDFSYRSYDYRVIKQAFVCESLLYLEIYSLAMDSWKTIEYELSEFLIFSTTGRLFERSIYWMGLIYGSKTTIFRFDLEEEIFEEVIKPPMEFLTTWKVVLERDQDEYILASQHIRKSRNISRKHYFVEMKESLMLFDQKDTNGYGFGTVFRPIGRQIKDY